MPDSMKWIIPLLLLASLLSIAPASAEDVCVGKTLASACYHGQTCTSGQVAGIVEWQPGPNCNNISIDPFPDPPCYGIETSKGLTGYCQFQNCQYWYVQGIYIEKTCWI